MPSPTPIPDHSSSNNMYEQTINPLEHTSLGVQKDGLHSQKSSHDWQRNHQIPTEFEQRQAESNEIAHENVLGMQSRSLPQSLTDSQDEATSSTELSSVPARTELPRLPYGINDNSSIPINCGLHSSISATPSTQPSPGSLPVSSSPISAAHTETRDSTAYSPETQRQSRPATEQSWGSSSENTVECDQCFSRFSIRKDLIRHQFGHTQPPQMADPEATSLEGTPVIIYHSSEQHPENFENTDLIREEATDIKSFIGPRLEASERKHDVALSGSASLSGIDEFDDYKDKLIEASRRSENVEETTADLFSSKESPQSDSKSSFDSGLGLYTRDEPRNSLLDRLMGYFSELLASCDSPVPFTIIPNLSTYTRYTPITSRVHRAKKSVLVHTCKTCRPPKTFTSAEHLRRHQLSHPTPQYPCTYPGCEREFYRAEPLARHATRHELEGDKASYRRGDSDDSRRSSVTSTGYDGPMQPSPAMSPNPSEPGSHHIHSADIPTINQLPPSLDDSPGLSHDTPMSKHHGVPRTSQANAMLIVTSGLGPDAPQAMANPYLSPWASSDSNPSNSSIPSDHSHRRGYNVSAFSSPPITSEWQSSFAYAPPTQGIFSPHMDVMTSQPTFFPDPSYPGTIDPLTSSYPEDSHNALDRGVGASRKRDLHEDDDRDDQGRNEGQSGKRTRVDDNKEATSRKLACPYFKKDPNYGQLARSCSGPGWDTVHRIKEHLDRNHALPPSCDRCYTAFKTDADRSVHLRSEIQCRLRERPSRMQGFDASQKNMLKGRPRGYKQMSEVHKWCHIYAILFPETEKADIPSPFYNYGTFQDPGHPVNLIVEYDRFLRTKMPERVRDQLERRIKDTLNPVEETLRGQIVEIVCEVQHELSQLFKSSINPTMHNSYSDPKAKAIEITRVEPRVDDEEGNDSLEPTSGAADGIQNCLGPEQSNLESVTEVYPFEPFLDTSVRDIDFQLFDFSSLVDGPLA